MGVCPFASRGSGDMVYRICKVALLCGDSRPETRFGTEVKGTDVNRFWSSLVSVPLSNLAVLGIWSLSFAKARILES